jgi:HlyD family secretion protein
MTTAPDSGRLADTRRLRWAIPAMLALAGLGGGLWWGLSPGALQVQATQVIRAPAQVVLAVPAHTRLRDRYRVAAPLAGTLEAVALRAGERVAAGQALAWLQPDAAALVSLASRGEAEAAVAEAQRVLEQARRDVADADAARDRARADAQRAEVLYAQELIDRDQVEVGHARVMSGDAALREAQARREAAQARLDAARALLDLQRDGGGGRLPLEAPIDGVVLEAGAGPVRRVAAGEAILEIGDPTAVEVVAELLTGDALRVGPGTPVSVRVPGRKEMLDARVRRVEPGLLALTSPEGLAESRMAVLADLDPVDAARARLRGGAPLEARFALPSAPDTLAIPTDALVLENNRWAVWVVAGGKARLRRVEPGIRGDPLTTLRGGVAVGDRVVRRPGLALREGVRVRTRP